MTDPMRRVIVEGDEEARLVVLDRLGMEVGQAELGEQRFHDGVVGDSAGGNRWLKVVSLRTRGLTVTSGNVRTPPPFRRLGTQARS